MMDVSTSSSSDLVELSVKVQGKDGWSGVVPVSLQSTAGELKALIAPLASVAPDGMRLLAAGRWLVDDVKLADQKITAKSKLMVKIEASAAQVAQTQQVVEDTKAKAAMVETVRRVVADVMKNDVSRSEYYFEVEDRAGNLVALDKATRDGITFGMCLHQKAIGFMKQGDYRLALELMLVAEREGFLQCKPEFLETIDNYGLLCLDLAWNYFKLKDPAFLTEAYARLTKASESFKRLRGDNMERMIQNDELCPELVMFVRLHLLNAIFAYHTGDTSGSVQWLKRVEQEIHRLRITDDELVPLLSLGFSATESRIGLRYCNRELERTVDFLYERRSRLQEQRSFNQRKRRFGKTSQGNYVDLTTLDSLVEMGFDENLAAEALKQVDNNQEAAINVLSTNAQLLRSDSESNDAAIQTIVAMGFLEEAVRDMLTQCDGDSELALERLLAQQSEAPAADAPASGDASTGDLVSSSTGEQDAEPETGTETETETEAEMIARLQQEEARLQQQDEVLEDVGYRDGDEHLDFALDEEFEVLTEYRAKLTEAGLWH